MQHKYEGGGTFDTWVVERPSTVYPKRTTTPTYFSFVWPTLHHERKFSLASANDAEY